MIEENNLDTAWLEARYRFDFTARNKRVEKACLDHFQAYPHLNIIDASAGIGSNFLYYFRKLQQDQNWTFFEEDPLRARNAIERIATFFRQQDLEFDYDDLSMEVDYEGRDIKIKVVTESYKQIEVFSDLEKTDWIIANSIFEKDAQETFEDFIGLLKVYKIPFLCTMNYAGMEFEEPEDLDSYYVRIYEQQLKRIHAFGKAMGKDCAEKMEASFLKSKWKVVKGNTLWRISKHDIKMHYYFLNFIEDAVRSCNYDKFEIKAFDSWLKDKKDRSLSEDIQMLVHHNDLFGCF